MPWKYVQYQNGQMRTTSDSGSSTLAGLTDTNISSPSDNQFLTYNSSSSKWVNTTKSIPSNLNDLSDVNTSGVANNKVLGYNSSSSKWVPMTIDPGGNVDDVEVNGTSVVTNKIAQITSYKELTRAEYDLLPDTKYSDGIMYCISDGFSNPNGFPPLIYSTEEREVGVWIDGKPLYQKTIIRYSITNGSEVRLITKNDISSDLEKVTSFTGFYYYESDRKYRIPLSTYDGTNYRTYAELNGDQTLVSYIKWSTGTIYEMDVTFQYTKTTDTAGSGRWATDGGLAKHYSTQEQIIGTWIDGKPIYEKIFALSSRLVINEDSWGTTEISASNIKGIVNATIYDINSITNKMTSVNIYMADCADSYIKLWNARNNTLGLTHVKLQYTKTTD